MNNVNDSGVKGLIAAVLRNAITEYKNKQTEELERFFEGNWCKSLCDAIELNYYSVIKKVKEIKDGGE